jgi:hypothetical protein
MVLIQKLLIDHRLGVPISRSSVKHGIKLERARMLLAKGLAFERISNDVR